MLSDDHDYFMHAETIALDFDLDYTNQLAGYEEKDLVPMEKLHQKVYWNRNIFINFFICWKFV